MEPRSSDPVQIWLDRHRAGENPSPNDLCWLCEERVRLLVRPQLRTFPLVVQESQTTDVVDSTLIRLLSALDKSVRLASILDLERFLARIIRRVLLDMHKSIQRRRQRVGTLADELIAAPEDDDDFDFDQMVGLHEYVESLPPGEQVLFDLFYYQGKTKEEVGRLLKIPPTTAHTRWTKARLRASRKLGHDLTH